MEISSHPLASTDSFSYSWLATEPSSHTEPRSNNEAAQNFDFDISISNSSNSLVHADKLFSNGRIVPRSIISSDVSSPPSTAEYNGQKNICPRKYWWKYFSWKIVRRCIGCMNPAGNVRRSRGRTRVDDVNRRAWEVQSYRRNNVINTPQHGMSPRRASDAVDHESSIHEAILYCKRSCGVCP